MSNAKLHPIYVALENQQYSRAIKLCLAQPASFFLARALLAHAYAKSGQRYKALVTLQAILGRQGTTATADDTFFPELRSEIMYSLEHRFEKTESSAQQQQQPQSATTPASAASKKASGKKGKKRGGGGGAASSSAASAQHQETASAETTAAHEDWDLVDQLDTPPSLPDDWEKLPPAATALTDETLLSTMSMTMVSILRLPLTAYQLYCWAASAAHSDEFILRKAYISGLAVLVAPHYQHIATNILANLQVLALQLSRIQQQLYGFAPAAAWAAQTALWQVQYHHDKATNKNQPQPSQQQPQAQAANDAKEQQRIALLPRLAESLSYKCVYAAATQSAENRLMETEDFLLYLRTLIYQQKYAEQVQAIDDRIAKSGEQMAPPRQTLLDYKSTALLELKQYTEARSIVEDLLRQYPDDWRLWTRHLECAMGETENSDGVSFTRDFIQTIQTSLGEQKYPVRGPQLMIVELAKRESNEALWDAIQEYGNKLAGCASCIFSDLSPYLDHYLETCTIDQARAILQWAAEKRVEPNDPNCRREQLRAYIFGVQVAYKVLAKFTDWMETELPPWQEIIRIWKLFESSEDKAQAQKESRPADDLVLLAVQQLLTNDHTDSTDHKRKLVIAACLLESAILCSPYNAYIKITAMQVYGELHAVARLWKLFKALHIKHIQHESCAFLILPYLQAGGFYRETISVCQEILRLQTAAIRDASDFAGRALENGSVSKAEEFIAFQRERMNLSLTTLEAKGLILDSAPMFVQDETQESIGAVHGIVGGEFDLERAYQMVSEAHNPSAAFSLLRSTDTFKDLAGKLADNRDFSIFSHEILFRRKFDSLDQVLRNSLRRGHHHRLLIRAALCLEATRGPKKGKMTKSSKDQEKRCMSLLASVSNVDGLDLDEGYECMLKAMHALCSSISAFGAGVYLESPPEVDTLESREERIAAFLNAVSDSLVSSRAKLGLDEPSTPVSRVSRLLPDCIVPVFALCRMCVKAADLYGWGPRKQKTKPCAAAIAKVVTTLSSLIDAMKTRMESLPDLTLTSDQFDLTEISELVEQSICDTTLSSILRGQELTRDRVVSVLKDIAASLDAFEPKE